MARNGIPFSYETSCIYLSSSILDELKTPLKIKKKGVHYNIFRTSFRFDIKEKC